MELEWRPRQPLMLKEWLELESSAELSRDGFAGCYPRRQLGSELRSRSASGCKRSRNGHVVARVSAAVRAALSSRPPSARYGEAAAPALARSLSRRLRGVGFWKKRKGELVVDRRRPVASCSAATTASSGREDGTASRSPAMSPRRMTWERRQAGRRSHETTTVAEGCECGTACQLENDEDREREQRLSPVSVMDFPSQDGDDDCNDHGGSDGHPEDDATSPTFDRSLASIRRASQELLQRIRRFEQLAELDTSDVDDNATTTAGDTIRYVKELDLDDEDTECGSAQDQLGLSDVSSPCAAHPFKKLLEDFFREGLSSSRHAGGPDDPDVEESLLEVAKAWLDGRPLERGSDGKAEVEEIERLGRWRCFREDELEPLSSDMEDRIFSSLMEELVEELC